MHKKKILICTDWFDPAYKAGGPIRSCVNLARHLSAYYEIYILAGDRDLGETKALSGIEINCWSEYSSCIKVWYASPETLGSSFMQKIIKSIVPDYIYLNSIFSKAFTIDVVLAHRKIKSAANLVLAPRGMLKPSALAIKPLKKKLFFWIAKFSGIYKSIHFHVTNEAEADEAKAVFGNIAISIANNFPAAILDKPVYLQKTAGNLNLVLVGRIHPIKNVDFILKQLNDIRGKIHLDVIGTPEDCAYRLICEAIIQGLPKEKTVRFIGELPNHLLNEALSKHHLFVLPTRGENFGHAIAEALGNGRPVLISDQTPWRNLTFYNAGWDCPLSSPEMFRKALQEAADWEQDTFDNWCNNALKFAKTKQQTDHLIQQYQQLFH